MKKIRRTYWNLSDDFGVFLWYIVGSMICVLFWLAFGNGLQWLKAHV